MLGKNTGFRAIYCYPLITLGKRSFWGLCFVLLLRDKVFEVFKTILKE